MASFTDLYPDLLRSIFSYCDLLDQYKLKCTCRKFRRLLRLSNFYTSLPATLINATNPYSFQTIANDIYPLLNENFILMLMIHLHPKGSFPNKWYLRDYISINSAYKYRSKSKYTEEYFSLNFYPSKRFMIFSVSQLLFVLNKYVTSPVNTIICINMLRIFLIKPKDKHEPSGINDFFWFPEAFKFDADFKQSYPNLIKIIRDDL